MALETTLIYNKPLLRSAVFKFWRRSVGVRLPLALLAMIGCLIWLVVDGGAPLLIGAVATVLAIGVAMVAAVYIVHYRNTMRTFRALGPSQGTFRADESTFGLSSVIGTATLQWAVIEQVWRFPDVWLLLLSRAQFITLPTDCLSDEMRAFILEHIEAAGGKIR